MSKPDPTKTLTLRNKAARETSVRYKRVAKEVRLALTVGDLITNEVTPGQFQFTRDVDKVGEFDAWLQGVINKEILDIRNGYVDPSNNWLNVYVGDGYTRGARKTRIWAEHGLKNLDKLPNYHPLANPFHIERAELIFQRVYSELEGVTEVMSSQMSRELSNAIIKGKGVNETAKAMVDRVDKIGITRTKLIARTEIVESYNMASINEAALLEKDTGVPIDMLWITSMDGRQRPTHGDRNGNIYSKDDAADLIGEPNCRCAITAHIDPDKI